MTIILLFAVMLSMVTSSELQITPEELAGVERRENLKNITGQIYSDYGGATGTLVSYKGLVGVLAAKHTKIHSEVNPDVGKMTLPSKKVLQPHTDGPGSFSFEGHASGTTCIISILSLLGKPVEPVWKNLHLWRLGLRAWVVPKQPESMGRWRIPDEWIPGDCDDWRFFGVSYNGEPITEDNVVQLLGVTPYDINEQPETAGAMVGTNTALRHIFYLNTEEGNEPQQISLGLDGTEGNIIESVDTKGIVRTVPRHQDGGGGMSGSPYYTANDKLFALHSTGYNIRGLRVCVGTLLTRIRDGPPRRPDLGLRSLVEQHLRPSTPRHDCQSNFMCCWPCAGKRRKTC